MIFTKSSKVGTHSMEFSGESVHVISGLGSQPEDFNLVENISPCSGVSSLDFLNNSPEHPGCRTHNGKVLIQQALEIQAYRVFEKLTSHIGISLFNRTRGGQHSSVEGHNVFLLDLSPLIEKIVFSSVSHTGNVKDSTLDSGLEDIECRIKSMLQKMPFNILEPPCECGSLLSGFHFKPESFIQGFGASFLICLK